MHVCLHNLVECKVVFLLRKTLVGASNALALVERKALRHERRAREAKHGASAKRKALARIACKHASKAHVPRLLVGNVSALRLRKRMLDRHLACPVS